MKSRLHLSSRYEKIHGSDGLCYTLIEQFNAMAEMRMMAECGDFFAYTCSALKADGMNDMIWKIEKLDWGLNDDTFMCHATFLWQRTWYTASHERPTASQSHSREHI